MVVLCVVILVIMIVFGVLRFCVVKIKNKKVLNIYKQMEAKVMFSSVLRYGIQQYLKCSITVMIAI
jgi:hypothetical protein